MKDDEVIKSLVWDCNNVSRFSLEQVHSFLFFKGFIDLLID